MRLDVKTLKIWLLWNGRENQELLGNVLNYHDLKRTLEALADD